MKRIAAVLVFAVASLICLAGYASEPLVELVASSESAVSDAGRVVAWRNVGALGGEARAVCGELRLSSDGRSFEFSDARLELRLPDSARELRNWTAIAVARVDRPLSIGLLSSRDGAVPLAQFDYDENGALRFIARDRAGRTLRAAIPVRQGEPFVASVVGRTDASGLTRVQLTVGDQSATASGRIELPVWGERIQIGGLEFPNARFSWQGQIGELWFFDTALDGAELERRTAEAAARYGIDQARATARPADSWNVLDRPKFVGEPDRELDADVCVVGAGSAGCAAAIAAGRAGARVALVERQKRLGGTGTNAFVSNWEGGPGDAIARELYERMKALGGAGVAKEYPHDE
ncbi:MAG: FAD-dependent oxidoreductase, partial [Thermoguttaceae bacterium]|nr:FAD-dependent oxidoreductase [Thermoguttaceae bacterium]